MSKNNSDQQQVSLPNSKKQDRWFVNNQIKLPKIVCIDSENKNLGLMPTNEALKLAQDVGLDLVQISPPNKEKNTAAICKILDYGKFKYEQSKKNKEMAKKNRESIVKLKEVKVTPRTGDNDLKFKAKQIDDFLKEGCKVKISLRFTGREVTHSDIGYTLIDKFLSIITEKYTMEQNIVFDRSGLTTIIVGE
jgi:translation initiation factor IF-3